MPKIINPDVLHVLEDPYFDHHAAMHLSRERLTLPDGEKLKLFLPDCACDDCMTMDGMIEAGQPGSGLEFLQMHHEMIRVFRFLIEHHDPPLGFPITWAGDQWQKEAGKSDSIYVPAFWDLDDPAGLPHEIVGMFNVTDPTYLRKVFDGVRERVRKADSANPKEAIDALGRFIERGITLGDGKYRTSDGSGIHNTLHEYLGAREGKAAQGAEMNKLRNSMFNDYFWSLHLWIDGHYGRLLKQLGQPFNTDGLDPASLDLCTHSGPHGEMTGMSMTGMSMHGMSTQETMA
jgi:hypothetical protein